MCRFLFVVACVAGSLVGCTHERPANVRIISLTSKHCRQCVLDKPVRAELAESYWLAEYDVDATPLAIRQFGVRAVPTYVLQIDGREVWRGENIAELVEKLGR